MDTRPTVLVVDDEEVVCSSCDRILSDEGFLVESSVDARRGLEMAEANDYAVVLLDIRMEEMDGLEYLERLRTRKPDIPVIMITGYPSRETLDVAMQRGASDYIHKPFTPEEITESVRRATRERPADEPLPSEVFEPPTVPDPLADRTPEEAERPLSFRYLPGAPHFLDEAWVRRCEDGRACLGAFLPRLHGARIDAVVLPRTGDVVRRGLPLAALTIGGGRTWIIPSPLSGTVTEVHRALVRHPDALWRGPFPGGWIARIRPERPEEEAAALKRRRVTLVAADRGREGEIASRLSDLGCEVRIHGIALAGGDLADPGVLVVDAGSCGEDGVLLVERLKRSFPELRTIVLGDAGARREAAYRAAGIFYYAVEPFADMEIADILFDAFRVPGPLVEDEAEPGLLPEWVSRLRLTDRRGRKASLLAEGRLLSRSRGLGLRLVTRILEGSHPVETTRTARPRGFDDAEILREAEECDVVLVLRAEDTGRVPGSVTIRTDGGGAPGRITTISVQPETSRGLPLDLDDRTTEALADFILEQITLSHS